MPESNIIPSIDLPASREFVGHSEDDQMLSLIAFGPADEYMKRAGIIAEPEEEKQMDEIDSNGLSKRTKRYLHKYGAEKIAVAREEKLSYAAEQLSVSVQTISNIRAAFSGDKIPQNGKSGEDGDPVPPELVQKPEGLIQVNIEIHLHVPSEITAKVRFVK